MRIFSRCPPQVKTIRRYWKCAPTHNTPSNNEKQHPRECAVSFATQCRIGLEYYEWFGGGRSLSICRLTKKSKVQPQTSMSRTGSFCPAPEVCRPLPTLRQFSSNVHHRPKGSAHETVTAHSAAVGLSGRFRRHRRPGAVTGGRPGHKDGRLAADFRSWLVFRRARQARRRACPRSAQ